MNRVEPLWWAEARAMRERGQSHGVISMHLHKHKTTVMYVVNPTYRDKQKAKCQARSAARARLKTPRSFEQQVRHKVVEAAHEEAVRRNLHVDLILIAWGQPARREMQSRRAGA